MKKILATAALLALSTGGQALAEEAATPKADPAAAQTIVNTVCVACHGADGNSMVPTYPKLAGQGAGYLLKQLHDFKSGQRKGTVMNGFAATLSDADMRNLAAFFSEQKTKPGTANDADEVHQGQMMYRAGNTMVGIPACAGCHGPSGSGNPVEFPRLAGQQPDYVVSELQKFRSGERANDPAGMMRGVAQRMTDQEMKAVAQYITALH